MRFRGERGAHIGEDCDPRAAVSGLACGAFDNEVGGAAEQHDLLDRVDTQEEIEVCATVPILLAKPLRPMCNGVQDACGWTQLSCQPPRL